MKKILLLILMVGGGWWYFHSSRILSEESVNEFYQLQTIATLDRKPEALCNQLATEYTSTGVLISSSGRARQEANKEQSCKAYSEMYENFEKLGDKMGGILQLDYDHRIQSITLSKDKKTATVETTFTLDVAGSIMNFQVSSVDSLIRRNGKVLLLHSESKTRVSSG